MARRRQLTIAAVAAAILGTYLTVAATSASAADGLLSQGKPATASSSESAAFPASNAVDGNGGTRWSSAFSDPQWLQVDLGATATISSVVLDWESAYARNFTVKASTNGSSWTTLNTTVNGTGGRQSLTVNGSGRYVRLETTSRATQWGVSLTEFQVFGSGGSSTPTTPTIPPLQARAEYMAPRARSGVVYGGRRDRAWSGSLGESKRWTAATA